MKTTARHLLFAPGLVALLMAPASRAADISLPVAADTFLFSGSPDANAGGHAWFDAGADGHLDVRRGLLRFDLAAIPAGSTIDSATLQLTVIKVPTGGGVDSDFGIYRVQADWTEGTQTGNGGALAAGGEATWNARMHGSASWTTAGAADDASPTASAVTAVGSGFTSYTWSGASVTADVQLWLDQPAQNFGWLLRSDAEGSLRSVRGFAARENGSSAGTLLVSYTPPAAPKPFSILSITQTNGTNVAEVWCGGQGPYALQKKSSLHDPTWFNAAFTNATNAVLTMDTPAGFLRVLDTANQPAIPLSAHLSGLSERPTPLVNTASGSGLFSLDGNTLTFSIRYAGLSGTATAAHIHGSAPASLATGIMIDLAPYNGGSFGSSGTLSGQVTVTDAQKAIILAGRTYVNVHTAANPGGEVRGQIASVLMQAALNGANERPTPVTTAARGLGVFTLVGNQLSFNLTYRSLSGAAIAAHIHGPATMSGFAGVLIDLAPYNGGAFGSSGTLAGTITLTPDQLASVVDGLTYVNLHTSANGGGEMRGQLVPQSTAVPFTAPLTGLSEQPTPIINGASGSGFFSLEAGVLHFSISYQGLSSFAIAAHIHGPSAATNSAGVSIDLAPFNGGAFGSTNGTLAGTVALNSNQVAMLLSGQSYVNVHTLNNGGGEIRGQIAPVLMNARLDGASERPTPIVTSGNALANFALVLNQLNLNLTYRSLSASATASHIHGPATTNEATGVLVDLGPFNGGAFGTSGSLVGTVTLTPAQRASLVDRVTYVNIHTSLNPGGEIRGQVIR
jgi:hypothetical protein